MALAALLALSGCGGGERAQRRACLQNLVLINEALNYAIPLTREIKPGTEIPESVFLEYLHSGALPRCPSGTAYRIPFVAGGRPVCPVHGDLLARAANIHVLGDKPIYPAEQ